MVGSLARERLVCIIPEGGPQTKGMKCLNGTRQASTSAAVACRQAAGWRRCAYVLAHQLARQTTLHELRVNSVVAPSAKFITITPYLVCLSATALVG